ncbi:hypothetical protein GCM10022269_09800 [Sphingorhabdus rigui]
MIVPTGNAFVATRTLGPVGTGAGATAAAAGGADAPVNMLRAIRAVTAAIKSAATSNMTFFLSMTYCSLKGPLIEPCYFM